MRCKSMIYAVSIPGRSLAFTSRFGIRCHQPVLTSSRATASAAASFHTGLSGNSCPKRYLIYWRGEHKEGYSQSFRHWEFLSALTATIATNNSNTTANETYHKLAETTKFANVFSFDPSKRSGCDLIPSLQQAELYNEALQFVSFPNDGEQSIVSSEIMANATKRCALIHSLYEVVTDGMEYSELVEQSFRSKVFNDMYSPTSPYHNTSNKQCSIQSWSLRRQEYSFADDANRPRFGKHTTRSQYKEKMALLALKPLLQELGGIVDLKHPELPLYLLEGLRDDISMDGDEKLYKILGIKLSNGAKHSVMAPNTRICKTNTPLCSISAHLLCNIAMIQGHQTVLDPFAGSGATLLAASLVAPGVRTVGIEVVPDESLSREKIRQDFRTRGLREPVAVLEGDAMEVNVRDEAMALIGSKAFDVIITDPPYGIRESMPVVDERFDGSSALATLFNSIKSDRDAGRPLLKQGGRLVAFQPCRHDQDVQKLIPSPTTLKKAGLQLEGIREQRLSNGLSRWVLSFSSI